MTIRVVCKNCGSKLNAKDELRGQTRSCPKCKEPVMIEPEPVVAPPVEEAPLNDEGTIRPLRLQPNNLYVVLGSDKEIAYWKNNEGWFVNVGTGYQSVKRAPERLPEVGNFVLVEGYVVVTDAGRRHKALRFKELTGRGVLNALIRSETEILEKAKTRTTLSQAQKRFMLEHIRKNYFYEFTDDAPEIIEYLTGYDAHMTSVGEVVDP